MASEALLVNHLYSAPSFLRAPMAVQVGFGTLDITTGAITAVCRNASHWIFNLLEFSDIKMKYYNL